MGKFKLKESHKRAFLYCNLLLFIGFVYLFYYLQGPSEEEVKEGITNMNCCGGVEAGVHYQETDTKPPEYIRRCFKSGRDGGKVTYEWNGFPCSSADGNECCPVDDDSAECIPTTGGGYCKSDSGDKIFRRGESDSSSYIKRGNDNVLDINDTIEMEDYFYDTSSEGSGKRLTPEMKAFMERRDQNNAFIQSHIVDSNRERIKRNTEARLLAEDELKEHQIKSTITTVHLLFIIGFSIVLKDLIIKDIDSFYTLLAQKLAEFTGKSVSGAVAPA